MPIYKGSTKIGKIYHGSTKIGKVYKGSTLVYSDAHKLCKQSNVYAFSPVKVGSPIFNYLGKITAINGTIGNNGSTITFYRSLGDLYKGAFIGSFSFDGFILYGYDAAQSGFLNLLFFVSQNQQVGDNGLETYQNLNTSPLIDTVTSISGNKANSTLHGEFEITNTPADYTYRA